MNQFERKIKNISPKLLSMITNIDGLKGQWIGGAQLNPQVLGRLKQFTLITSTGASTRIEGARLSDTDVEGLLHGLKLQRFADRDKQEVRGYYELLNNVFSAWRTLRFSENLIKHFHKELLQYVVKDEGHRGEYKKSENQVVMKDAHGKIIGIVFDPTLAYLTPKEIQELVEWTMAAFRKNRFHPLLVLGVFLVEFLKIHPFQDGNGRLSRILTNLLLLQSGYAYVPYVSHEKLIEDNKTAYYIALRKSQRTKDQRPDITSWLEFFFEILLTQAQQAITLLSTEQVEKLLSKKQLAVWQYIKSATDSSPGVIAKETGVARPTVNQVLEKLLRLKKIERVGLGRSTRYRKI